MGSKRRGGVGVSVGEAGVELLSASGLGELLLSDILKSPSPMAPECSQTVVMKLERCSGILYQLRKLGKT